MAEKQHQGIPTSQRDQDVENDDLCPICIEPMPAITWRNEETRRLLCCGNSTCRPCGDALFEQVAKLQRKVREQPAMASVTLRQYKYLQKCPVCRESMPHEDANIVPNLLRLSKKGIAWAQYNLSVHYSEGKNVPIDKVQSTRWCKAAAEQGHMLAMHKYATCLEDGIGCKKSQSEGIEWRQKAAEAGNAGSQHLLGHSYFNGDGVEKNEEKALDLWRTSADLGYEFGQLQMGICYENGKGVPVDLDEALRWYTMAAEQGCQHGQLALGMCYQRLGNSELAMQWMAKSADQGNTHGMHLLAMALIEITIKKSLFQDIPGQCNYPRAIKYLRRAASLGFGDAVEQVEVLEKRYSHDCANCQKEESNVSGKLLRCAKCKLFHYCSKKCQVDHWKRGHKKDCWDQSW